MRSHKPQQADRQALVRDRLLAVRDRLRGQLLALARCALDGHPAGCMQDAMAGFEIHPGHLERELTLRQMASRYESLHEVERTLESLGSDLPEESSPTLGVGLLFSAAVPAC